MSKIKLYFKPSKNNIKRLEKCPSIYQPAHNIIINENLDLNPTIPNNASYEPPCFLNNSYLMVLYSSYANKKKLNLKRETIINKEDGGIVALDWYKFENELPYDAPIVIIGHSLKGGSRETQIQSFAEEAHLSFGFRPVVFINRGHSGLKFSSEKADSACFIEDFDLCIDLIKKRYNKSKLFTVGFCFGGMSIIRHLYSNQDKSPITAFGCVSVPLDLGKTFDNVTDYFWNHMIYFSIIHPIMVKFYTKLGPECLQKLGINNDDIANTKTLRELDEIIIAKMYQFGTAQDYYDDANMPIKNIDKLAKPILFINAEDDTITPASDMPIEKLKLNENVTFAVTERGSHLGFIRSQDRKMWCNIAVLEYFKTFIEESPLLMSKL